MTRIFNLLDVELSEPPRRPGRPSVPALGQLTLLYDSS